MISIHTIIFDTVDDLTTVHTALLLNYRQDRLLRNH